jgi:hypothetical protein
MGVWLNPLLVRTQWCEEKDFVSAEKQLTVFQPVTRHISDRHPRFPWMVLLKMILFLWRYIKNSEPYFISLLWNLSPQTEFILQNIWLILDIIEKCDYEKWKLVRFLKWFEVLQFNCFGSQKLFGGHSWTEHRNNCSRLVYWVLP